MVNNYIQGGLRPVRANKHLFKTLGGVPYLPTPAPDPLAGGGPQKSGPVSHYQPPPPPPIGGQRLPVVGHRGGRLHKNYKKKPENQGGGYKKNKNSTRILGRIPARIPPLQSSAQNTRTPCCDHPILPSSNERSAPLLLRNRWHNLLSATSEAFLPWRSVRSDA